MADSTYGTGTEIEIGVTNRAHNIKAVLLSSADGRWCVEAGVEGADAVIRTVFAGTVGPNATNSADDEPASVACSASHGIGPGNIAFRFNVRFVNNTIYLYINGSSTALLRHELTADEEAEYGRNRHWGFVSDQTSAKVRYAKLCTLTAVISDRADWMAGVCGGGVYIVRDETGPFLVRGGVFPTTGRISLAAYGLEVFGVGGGRAIVLDLDTLAVSDWGDATGAGVLPGASETAPSSGVYIPGTTRMEQVGNFLDRIRLSGDPVDPQNLWYCATGDPYDWDTAAINAPGRAFAFSASFPGRIGEPVLGVIQSSKGVDIIGCRNSIWRLRGDPAIAIPDVSPVSLKIGISGPEGMETIANGLVAAHSPEGLLLIGEDGPPVNLSADTLTEGIQFPREDADNYLVQVRQDPRRHLVYVYLTPTTQPAAPTIHFAYCLRTGRLSAGGGGWFPITLPASMGPTASCLWRGRLILGTFDGYLVEADDGVKTDDGTAINCNIPFGAIRQSEGNLETIVRALIVERAVATPQTSASDIVRVRVFGGLTTEMACAGSQRWKRLDIDAAAYNRPVKRVIRDPVIVVEASNNNLATRSIRVEAIHADILPGRRVTHHLRATPAATVAARPADDISYPTTPDFDPPDEGPGPGDDPVALVILGLGGDNFTLTIGQNGEESLFGGSGAIPAAFPDVADGGGLVGGGGVSGGGAGPGGIDVGGEGGTGIGGVGDVVPW